MDYESAYKQALERAKSMMALPDDKAMIEEIFPELAEPDDERVRKELIDYFSASHATDTFRGISWDRVVSWLEKQCEQKPAWSEEEIEKCAREAEDNNCIILAKHIRQLKSLRPQNTWKPSDKQMQVLHWCMPLLIEPKPKAILESLINDLKKLK